MLVIERRRQRSQQSSLALAYQLEHTRQKGHLEALVLASDEGLPVATSGEPAVCAELAAVAPWLGRSVLAMPMPPLLRGAEVACRTVRVHGERLYLISVGGTVARDAHLSTSVLGLERILTGN